MEKCWELQTEDTTTQYATSMSSKDELFSHISKRGINKLVMSNMKWSVGALN